jgi:hypothetical protein
MFELMYYFGMSCLTNGSQFISSVCPHATATERSELVNFRMGGCSILDGDNMYTHAQWTLDVSSFHSKHLFNPIIFTPYIRMTARTSL